jgi:hypothetical protein
MSTWLRLTRQVFRQIAIALGRVLVAIALFSLIWFQGAAAYAQPAPTKPPLLKQFKNTDTPQPMTDAEKAQLQDPFFQLVLKNNTDAKDLTAINNLLKPQSQELFVVDERIAESALKVGNNSSIRRGIMTVSGTTNQQKLDNNVLFSVLFTPDTFPTANFIEIMGWDEKNGVYNYYKLEKSANETTSSWRFRGSSKDADKLTAEQRGATCLRCHINGGTVMKELVTPWNNWESGFSPVAYLRRGSGAWPIVGNASSPFSKNQLADAYGLQDNVIQPTITRFNETRIKALKSADGQTVTDARRLLKPLFTTTEFNLMSSFQLSAFHPFSRPTTNTSDINIPDSFFFNSNLISSVFDIFETFSDFSNISRRDYAHLLQQTKTALNDKVPGDTNFAWFGPEASFMDNDFVRQLVSGNTVPKQFAAAALAVDIENPVFSSKRAKLLSNSIIPAQFKVGTGNDLVSKTIANLTTLNPAAGTPEADFLQLLKTPDASAALKKRLTDYIAKERKLLGTGANPQERSKEWIRLYKLELQRRETVLADPTLTRLDETGGKRLFARGDVNANVSPLPSATTPPRTRPTLRQGAKGDDVVFLQQRLRALGFLTGPADGDFGPGTRAAVVAAQRQFGLEADGIVGPTTWARLQQ